MNYSGVKKGWHTKKYEIYKTHLFASDHELKFFMLEMAKWMIIGFKKITSCAKINLNHPHYSTSQHSLKTKGN